MIRVLQVGMTDNLGGIETFLMNYYRHIDKSKIQFDFINIYEDNLCFSDEIQKMGGLIYKVSNYYKHPLKYIHEVVDIINSNNYKIVHCNMNSAAIIYPLIACKLSNAKIVISHSHNSSSDKGLLKEILHNINKNFIPFLATDYFACSDIAGKWFFSQKIRNSKNYKIIYNAVDLEKFKYNELKRINKRKELNIANNTFVIGHVGRFCKQKNHRFLLNFFAQFHNENNNSKLILIGQGPLMEKMKEQVKKLNIENDVLFLGQRNDINELYFAMDAFALPSLYEGLPLVGVEAQTSGLKCYFSDNITKELSLSNSCEYLPLMVNEWVKKIKPINYKRISNKIDTSKFDICHNASVLQKIYMEEI